jgi:AraC family transcriptional regulator, transcriptional activator of pobA
MNMPFDIYELTAELALKISAAPLAAHRHDFEELLIITKGDIVHFIDAKKEEVSGPVVIYVAEGKVHQFIPGKDARGWVVRYRSEFIPESKFHFYSHFLDWINYKLDHNFCINSLDDLCRMMLRELQQSVPEYATIKHLLNALISKLESEGDTVYIQNPGSGNTQLVAFNNFLKILQNNYKRPEGVQFYADRMNTSVRNLNLICTTIFGKSVSEIIETRKLIEARHLLLNSDKSISEIGYELGYNEKSYFSRVFRKKTGLSPSEFRMELKTAIA